MNRSERNRYLGILAKEISSRYGTPIEITKKFVKQSQINVLLDQRPEFVDHISVETWSREVHEEMIERKFN